MGENNKEDLIVVLAGYKDKMDRFYSFIPGMESRIGNHIEFPNYEVDELVEIGKVMCRELQYNLGPDAESALRAYMAQRMQMPFFANARTIRHACVSPSAFSTRRQRRARTAWSPSWSCRPSPAQTSPPRRSSWSRDRSPHRLAFVLYGCWGRGRNAPEMDHLHTPRPRPVCPCVCRCLDYAARCRGHKNRY